MSDNHGVESVEIDPGITAAIVGSLVTAALGAGVAESQKAGNPGGRDIAVTVVNATPFDWVMEPEVPLHGGWDKSPTTVPDMCSPLSCYKDGMTPEQAANVNAADCVKEYSIEGRGVGTESLVIFSTKHSATPNDSNNGYQKLIAAVYVKHKTGGHRQAGAMLCKQSTYTDLAKGNDKHGDKIIKHIQETDNSYTKLKDDGDEVVVTHSVKVRIPDGHSSNPDYKGTVKLTVIPGNNVTFTLSFSGKWDGVDWG